MLTNVKFSDIVTRAYAVDQESLLTSLRMRGNSLICLLQEIANNVERVIEFTKDSERATVTFLQGRHKGGTRKQAADHLGECQIVA